MKITFSNLFLNRFSGILESYYNTKYGGTGELKYKARREFLMDVRNLILTKSFILEPNAKQFTGNNDEKTLKILRFVKNMFVFVGDIENNKEIEYWENPEITWQKEEGDCEDGALLIVSLMRMAGIPAWRVKICAGWVKDKLGNKYGHAYAIYLSEESNQWYVLDWCFYPEISIKSFNNTPHKDLPYYLDIWWTFNDENAFPNQHSSVIEW